MLAHFSLTGRIAQIFVNGDCSTNVDYKIDSFGWTFCGSSNAALLLFPIMKEALTHPSYLLLWEPSLRPE